MSLTAPSRACFDGQSGALGLFEGANRLGHGPINHWCWRHAMLMKTIVVIARSDNADGLEKAPFRKNFWPETPQPARWLRHQCRDRYPLFHIGRERECAMDCRACLVMLHGGKGDDLIHRAMSKKHRRPGSRPSVSLINRGPATCPNS